MAPRFVEVSKPVEAGVEWVSSMPSAFNARVVGLVPKNITSIIYDKFDSLFDTLPEVKALEDFKSVIISVASSFPEPRQEVTYLAILSVAALLLRSAFVLFYSRSIVANYGATKVIAKEY